MKIKVDIEATAAIKKPAKKLPKRDPNDYHWYKCTKGRAHFGDHSKDHDVTITPGDIFGLKFYRGKYFLLDKSDMTMQFGLTKDEGLKVIKNSEPFKGKIAGKKVTPGATHSEVKAGGVAKKAGEKKLTAAEKRKQTADDLAAKKAKPAAKTSSTPVAGKSRKDLEKELAKVNLVVQRMGRRSGKKTTGHIAQIAKADKLKRALARMDAADAKVKSAKDKAISDKNKKARDARPQKEKDEAAAATKALRSLKGTHWLTASNAMDKITGTKSKAKVKELVTDVLVKISLDTYSKNRDMLEHDFVSNSPEMKEFLADFSPKQTWSQVTNNVMNLRKKFRGKKGVSHTPAAKK